MAIEIKMINSVNAGEMLALYRGAGWVRPEEELSGELLNGIVAGSFRFAGAFEGGCLIGMGRAISDGVSDAYIQDVTVLSAYRSRGIGRQIIQGLVEQLKKAGIGWIGLIAEPETSFFYTELGFKPLERYTPMLFKGDL